MNSESPVHLLVRGIKNQLLSDRTQTATELARFVIAERPAIRALDRALRATRHTPLPVAFALINGLRCYARMNPVGPSEGVLACANRPGERRAVAGLRAMLADVPWCDVDLDLRGSVGALAGLDRGSTMRWQRVARIAKLLWRRHEPFQVTRAIELIFHHERFGDILDRGGHRVAVISTYSNPWGIALHVAAQRRGVPVVLVMHGAPLWPIPRLDYDLVVVNGPAAEAVLRRAGCRIGRAIHQSAQREHRPLPATFPARDLRVGIFLSKDPARDRVLHWIRSLSQRATVGAVVVRPHPANLWLGLPAAIAALADDRVTISAGGAVVEDLRRCHLVIAGTSSVHIEALAAGVPSVHARGLDHAPVGGLSFFDDGLVMSLADANALVLDDVLRFYMRPEWSALLRRYVDVDRDAESVAREIRASIDQLLVRRG